MHTRLYHTLRFYYGPTEHDARYIMVHRRGRRRKLNSGWGGMKLEGVGGTGGGKERVYGGQEGIEDKV